MTQAEFDKIMTAIMEQQKRQAQEQTKQKEQKPITLPKPK